MKIAIFSVCLLAGLCVIEAQFDRNYVGVAFSPYVDNVPGDRAWNAYTVQDLKTMLRVIRRYFTAISTYSMGVSQNNRGKPWDQADSNALIARAAAQLNRERSSGFNVNIGVYQDGLDASDRQREIDNAYAAAADANRIAPGTVWGITFTNEYIKNVGQANEVLQMIQRNRGKNGLKVGTRTEHCDFVNDGGDLGRRMKDIIRNSDFIYCNVYASRDHSRLGPDRAAREVMNYFLGLRDAIKRVKNIDVQIGETGWPSSGNSFNDSENTVQNLTKYWEAMARLAASNRVKVQMFEAIDEPWKAQRSQWKGEGKYGWWYRQDNRQDKYIEKKTGRVM